MTYKFYDKDAFLYKYPEIYYDYQPNEKVIFLSNLITEKTGHTMHILEFFKINKIDYEFYKFEDYMLNRLVYDYGDKDVRCLATALDYDCTQHPDETIFITDNEEMADIANLYFGEDSIICLSPCPN